MLETRVMKEDEEILDLEGDEIEEAVEKFRIEFEATEIGKTILKEGFTYQDYDADDINISIVYFSSS